MHVNNFGFLKLWGLLFPNPKSLLTQWLYIQVQFPALEKLRIYSLESLRELWHNELSEESFCQLTLLEIRKCDKLLRVVPSNLLPRLEHLEELSAKHCNSLEKIIEQREDSFEDKIMFPKVHTLRLVSLPNLQSFCLGSSSFEFSSLGKVNLEDCPNMQTFSSRFLITPKLNVVQVGYHQLLWKGDLNSTVQHLFKVMSSNHKTVLFIEISC